MSFSTCSAGALPGPDFCFIFAPYGYDEPEILPSRSPSICLKGTDGEHLSSNLIVQLGVVTEDLNRHWYEANTGHLITDIQRRLRHPILRWMGATLDGRVVGSEAVFEAKFMLPWSFSEEAALAKYMPQLQHNMWVVVARSAVLSVITGGGKWVEITA